jgi:hypothetical protein
VWTFGSGSAAGDADADAVGAGVDDTATVGPWLADNEAASDGLGLSDGPAVHAITRSPMAATSRPKPRLMPDTVAARLGGGVGDDSATSSAICGDLACYAARLLHPRLRCPPKDQAVALGARQARGGICAE